MKKELYLLFISYRHGMHYNSLHVSIDNVVEAIKELCADLEIKEYPPDKKSILQSIEDSDDFYYMFEDSTWIHVQELSPYLKEELIETIKREEGEK